jgi:hypothetical protein
VTVPRAGTTFNRSSDGHAGGIQRYGIEVNYGSARLLSTDVFAHRFPCIAVGRTKHGKAACRGVPIAFGRKQVGMCHGKLTPPWLSYSRGNVAREGTEGPCKPGSDRRRVSKAGEEGSRRHACGVRLRTHTRGAAFGGGPQAPDCRDERQATRPYACQWPPRGHPAGPACRPELARVGSGKAGTTRRLTVAGACNAPGARKVLSLEHCHRYGSRYWRRPTN